MEVSWNTPPLGRNLAENDYPPDPRIPSRDQVLEELRESTFQYTNVSDPSEAAARKQRVIHSEENGLMEQTADRIIVAASNTLLAINAETDQSYNLQGASYISGQTSQALPPAAPFSATLGSSRRTHNGTGTSRCTSASPRNFPGTNLRKRNIAHGSVRHGFPFASPIQPHRLSSPTSQIATQAGVSRAIQPSASSSDFHTRPPPLP